MTRRVAARVAMATVAVSTFLASGCGDSPDVGASDPASVGPASAAEAQNSPVPATTASATGPDVEPVAGAPIFAALYPGAVPDAAPTLAQSPAGPGGIVTYTTEATPDEVIAFYRKRAEASGLKSINAMHQGEARGYSAGDGADGRGQLLSVVATPMESGSTSVQLDWSAGR